MKLKAVDLQPDSLLTRIIYTTVLIRNLQEDRHELYSMRRNENQRLEAEKYLERAKDIGALIEMRNRALAELRMIRIEHYIGVMKSLKLEFIEPPRKNLPFPPHMRRKEQREKF